MTIYSTAFILIVSNFEEHHLNRHTNDVTFKSTAMNQLC